MISWNEPFLAAYTATFSSSLAEENGLNVSGSSIESGGAESFIQTTTATTTQAPAVLTTTLETVKTLWSSTSTSTSTINSFGATQTRSTWSASVVEAETSTTTWTTASTSTATTIVTELSETILANVARTIYEAESNEILYVAPTNALSGWDGVGFLPVTATRTTIEPRVLTVALVPLNLFDDATNSASSSFGSTFVYNRSTSFLSTITTANLDRLPHTTRTFQIIAPSTTASTAGVEGTLNAQWIQNASVEKTQSITTVQTKQKFNGTVSYADLSIIITAQAYTSFPPVVITFATSQTTGVLTGGSTEAGGGNTTLFDDSPRLGLRTNSAQPSWSVFGLSGAKDVGGIGLRYDITNTDLSVVSLASVSRGKTLGFQGRVVTILPATNESYTANSSALTFTRTRTGSTTSTTSSVEINATGFGIFTVLSSRVGLLGGAVGENETVVQRAIRGVYLNQTGGSTFFNGDDTSYVGSESSQTTFYKAAPVWVGDGLLGRVRAFRRNEDLLPSFVPQNEEIYGTFEEF